MSSKTLHRAAANLSSLAAAALLLAALPAARAQETPGAATPAARLVEWAKKAFVAMENEFLRGLRAPEDLYQWSRRWRDAENVAASERVLTIAAEKAVAVGHDYRINAAKEHLERMKKVEHILELKVKTGAARPSELLAARYYVADAQRAALPEGGLR